jgi:hypothetical protein
MRDSIEKITIHLTNSAKKRQGFFLKNRLDLWGFSAIKGHDDD